MEGRAIRGGAGARGAEASDESCCVAVEPTRRGSVDLRRFPRSVWRCVCADATPAVFRRARPKGRDARRAEGNLERALEAYDDLLARLDGVAGVAARALVSKGMLLAALERREEAIRVFDLAVATYGDATEISIRNQIAWSMFNKGLLFMRLGRFEEAISAYDALLTRFGDDTEPYLRTLVAEGLYNKGDLLYAVGRFIEALVVFDSLLARFGDEPPDQPPEKLVDVLVDGLLTKGASLVKLGRTDEAIEAYDELVRRYGADAKPGRQERVARTLVFKAYALGENQHSARPSRPAPSCSAVRKRNRRYMRRAHRQCHVHESCEVRATP